MSFIDPFIIFFDLLVLTIYKLLNVLYYYIGLYFIYSQSVRRHLNVLACMFPWKLSLNFGYYDIEKFDMIFSGLKTYLTIFKYILNCSSHIGIFLYS